nr:ABC transporter ATP-binding protein [Pseudomonas sp.]
MLLEIGAAVSSILMPYAIGQIVGVVTHAVTDGAAGSAPGDIVALAATPLLLFVGLSIGELIFNRASGACRVIVTPRQRTTVARELFAYLQQHSHRYFSNNFAGSLSARISETSVGVNMTISTTIFEFMPLLVTLSVSVSLLYKANLTLALFTLAWSIAFVGVSFWLARRARPYAQRHAAARAETSGRIVDAVTNLVSVRLFSRLAHEYRHLKQTQDKEIAIGRNAMWFNEKVQWFQMSAALVLKVGTLYFAITLWRDGEIGIAEFVMATSLSLLIIGEARNIGRRFLDMFEYIGNISNGVQTIMQPHEITDRPDARDVVIHHGEIEFRDVDFGYSPDKLVFQGVNLRIPAGQRVGLVGFSGSGKSTLVNLIMRLYEPQRGSISIDGVDIRDMTQASLHAQIGLIPQEPGLFHRSLMENIRYGRVDASDEEVYEAARQASADEFIQDMPRQYESLVGERGIKLSGGQRQRVAIARVVMKNAPILIMDEATSSLDSITEKAIQDSLDELMRNKTVIVVAHRLST